jgi:hypothetical protein
MQTERTPSKLSPTEAAKMRPIVKDFCGEAGELDELSDSAAKGVELFRP